MPAALEQGEAVLLINFASLGRIGPAGPRVLPMGVGRLRQSGGAAALCALDPSIHAVFEISGFLAIFTAHDDRVAALATMGRP